LPRHRLFRKPPRRWIIRPGRCALGGEPLPGSPADFGKSIAEETDKCAKVVRAAGLKPE
jgi:hypothetical protein